MVYGSLRVLTCSALLTLGVAAAAAQDCSGTITADETMKAELARYYNHSSAIWAKRPGGLEFVSWQSTGIPNP